MRRLLVLALLAAVAHPAPAQEVACVGGAVFVPDVGEFACDGVSLVGYLPVDAFATDESPAANANNDIWGWTDPQTGTEYALVGTENGTAFVDLSDPTRPRFVGKLPTQTTPSPWRDLKVYADHVFVVAEAQNHGVQIFDLRRLREADGPPVTFEADAVYDRIGSAHNVVVNEATGFAYAVGFRLPEGAGLPASCDVPGFHAIDVRDPQNPAFAGCFSDVAAETGMRTPGYTHDAQCIVYDGPDADHTGREVCLASNEDVVSIFDVTDKSDARLLSQAAYPNSAYTHQGWLTEDRRFFLVNDEGDESGGARQRTIVFDVSDLDDPEVAFIYDSGLTTIDHNLYVRDGYAFESNYETGLRILDLGGVTEGEIAEVAFFDTFPTSDNVAFNGQWSNYPFFESGLVIANDRQYGLFVLRPDVLVATDATAPPAAESGFALSGPTPNPTPSTARLALRVEAAQRVRADVYDLSGRHVRALHAGEVRAGRDLVLTIDGADLPAGVYVVRVVGERFEASRSVTIAR